MKPSVPSSLRFYVDRFSCLVLLVLSAFALLPCAVHASVQIVSLNSGERLVGEILPQSTEQTVVLKSDILGEVSLPRERVVKIEAKPSAGAEQVQKTVSQSPEPKAPSARTVAAEAGEAEEARIVDELVKLKAPDSWNGDLRMGLNLSQGDRKWSENYFRGKLEIQQKGDPNFYRLDGSYIYRKSEKSNGDRYKSTDKYDGTFTYRRRFAGEWFLQNSLGVRADQVKGIEREIQELVGVGYKYKPTGKMEFLFGVGGGIEDFRADFEDTREGLSAVMNIFQEFTWRPLARTSVVQKFNYYSSPDASERFNYVLTTALRIRLTDLLGFEFSYNKDFDNDIGSGDSKDDTQWRNSLIVYF
jgi:putative salt-induced outer membrane protein YdiY